MTVNDLIKFYGNMARASKAGGFSIATVGMWKYRGWIPTTSQYRFEALTKGKLKATEGRK